MGTLRRSMNIVAILLAGAGVFYQLGAELPASRRPAWDRERAAARQPELEQCGEAAALNHDIGWAAACMLVAQEARARHAGCLGDPLVMDSPRLGKQHCDKTYSPEDDSPECTLPRARAAILNAQMKNALDRCLDQAGAKNRSLQ